MKYFFYFFFLKASTQPHLLFLKKMTDYNNNLNLLRCLVTFIQGSRLLENQSQNIQISFNAFAGSVTQQCSSGYTSMPVVNTGFIPMMSTNGSITS